MCSPFAPVERYEHLLSTVAAQRLCDYLARNRVMRLEPGCRLPVCLQRGREHNADFPVHLGWVLGLAYDEVTLFLFRLHRHAQRAGRGDTLDTVVLLPPKPTRGKKRLKHFLTPTGFNINTYND